MPQAGNLTNYEPIGFAISTLFAPHAEVILHDLSTGRIAAIWNAFSARRVGDESLLDGDLSLTAGFWGPYAKSGLRGEKLRSVSAVLHSGKGEPIGLLCINLDVTEIEGAIRVLQSLVAAPRQRPPELFDEDWRERMQLVVQGWLDDKGLTVRSLTREERIELVRILMRQGLCETRNAANHATALLGISRSTFYNYMRAANGKKFGEGSPA